MRDVAPASILVADWSKAPAKRAVWCADVTGRRVGALRRERWDLSGLLEVARLYRRDGPVLVAVDLVLGVPRGYWAAATARPPWRKAASFVDLLANVVANAEFWGTSRSAGEWRVEQPFYAVPPGKGSLNASDTRAGYPLKRDVDLLCRPNPPFCVSGIPGTVGSGTRSLWQELAPLLRGQRDFRVWPFEGTLDAALGDGGLALAELYPALAYAAALLPRLPGHLLNVSKTKRDTRDLALNSLLSASWRQNEQVTIEDLDLAYRSEDHFDALLGAAALLRQYLRRAPLDDSDRDDPVAEGGILLTGAIDFRHPARTLRRVFGKPAPRSATEAATRPSVTRLSCPIPGCTKVFAHGRSGWDGHVGSRRLHPGWYPELEDAEARRTQFRKTFADWFP